MQVHDEAIGRKGNEIISEGLMHFNAQNFVVFHITFPFPPSNVFSMAGKENFSLIRVIYIFRTCVFNQLLL